MAEAPRRRLGRLLTQFRSVELDGDDSAAAASASLRRPPHPARPGDPEGFGAPVISTRQPATMRPRTLDRAQDLPGADAVGLTPEEAAHFREFGYVVKRNLIPSEELEPFVDLLWQQPPVVEAGLKREDPSTWVAPGKRWPKENTWGTGTNWMGGNQWPTTAEIQRPGATVGERVMRTPYNLDCVGHMWRWHGIGHDEAFLEATSRHPRVLHMVEALLGDPVRRPRRNRGIYSVFPREELPRLAPHVDGNGSGELKAVTNLQPVLPRSGGFTIWPGSHRLFYPTGEQDLNWMPTDRSKEVMDQVKATIEPVEFVGGPGDTIFVHGLMMHSVGLNESGRIRMAVIHDFCKVRPRGPLICKAAGKHGGPSAFCNREGIFALPTDDPEDDPADGDREVTTQWHVDGNECAQGTDPPREDMFADWNLGAKPVVGNIVDEPSWWEKYGLPIAGPRGGGGMAAVPLSQIATYEGDGAWRLKPNGNAWMEK